MSLLPIQVPILAFLLFRVVFPKPDCSLCPVTHLQLVEDIATPVSDCLFTQLQLLSNLFVAQSLCY